MSFFSITGLNHKSAPVELREKLSFTGDKYEAVIKELREEEELAEFALLSTCNRTEFIFRSETDGAAKILKFLCQQGDIEEQELREFIYELDEFDALSHLYRVGSGLNSLVVGETQILGQVKNAFEDSLEKEISGKSFLKIYQSMLQCAKAVRHGTDIGKGSLSVSFIAVQLAKNIFSSFHDKKVLLVGAGEMCELAGVHFNEAGVESINVVNRSFDRAEKLASKFDGKAFPLDELVDACSQADIILSSTGAEDFILTYELIAPLALKRREPLFLIDIAVPRDIEPKVNELNDIFLYNIDDLNQIAQENQKSRNKAVHKADEIIAQQVNEFREGIFTANLGPVISSLKKRSEEVKVEELDKLFRKNDHLSDDDRKSIERSVNLIVNKILHDPIISLREGVKKERSSRVINVFKDFFNL